MPLIARTPRNRAFIKKHSSYRSHLNVLDRKKTAVQRQIKRGGMGSYEPSFQAALLALCEISKSPLVFYDVGAHIGIYSSLVATIFKTQNPSIVAFEPTPDTADMARKLRDANELAYSVLEMAVSDSDGEVNLYISPKAETSNSLNANFRNSEEAHKVKQTTIDSFIETGVMPPSIIKIDVETFEENVLRGALSCIRRYRPIITCEFLPQADFEGLGAMIAAIEYMDYHIYRVEEKEQNWRRYAASEVQKHMSSRERDWVLSPFPLDSKFYDSRRNWIQSVNECDVETNVLVDGGANYPDKLFKDW